MDTKFESVIPATSQAPAVGDTISDEVREMLDEAYRAAVAAMDKIYRLQQILRGSLYCAPQPQSFLGVIKGNRKSSDR